MALKSFKAAKRIDLRTVTGDDLENELAAALGEYKDQDFGEIYGNLSTTHAMGKIASGSPKRNVRA